MNLLITQFRFANFLAPLIICGASLGLSACGYQPIQLEPNVSLASEWQATVVDQTDPVPHSEWWQSFATPELNQLIEQALVSSPDLLSAQQRVLQAQAQLGITRANRQPQLDASLTAEAGTSRAAGASFSTTENSSLGLSTSYEIDLWGRLAAQQHASLATLHASEFDWQATKLTLTAGVASSWFRWLLLQEQLQNANWYLHAAEQQLQILEAGWQQGTNTHTDLARQRRQVLTRQASVQQLHFASLQAKHALALLLGVNPQEFTPPLADLLAIQLPRPNPGLPVDILSRRPDLASAEARLQAAAANVYMAKKAIYPSLSLTASARLASGSLNLADPSQSFSLGAGLVQSIFDFGLRRRQVALSQAQQEELLINYTHTVVTALVEVEEALSNQTLRAQLEEQQRQLLAENQFIAQQSKTLYAAGAETLANLLDAQQEELQAQDQLLEAYWNRLEASLNLYKVLGGGWQG